MRQNIASGFNDQVSLVRALKANDDAVLKILYRDNYPKAERYVLENSGTEEDAKDVFQEAFIAAWRNIQLDKFYPENETALAGYIFQIAKFKWIDRLRADKKNRVISIDETIRPWQKENEENESNDDDFIQQVKKSFKNLGEVCREILSRFYFKKESLRTIASHTGLTEATARNNKYRCLQRLREMVKTT
ncbi:sigma-70 family RNA polymerase sigma factor [Pollutibacter soli]|uniref:RNA polymerase sigma factor n=1 Tax=Pollutibacter soli TaxID=3034157 RepID=UPI0030136F86